jgi:hypothetical protein
MLQTSLPTSDDVFHPEEERIDYENNKEEDGHEKCLKMN